MDKMWDFLLKRLFGEDFEFLSDRQLTYPLSVEANI